MSRSISMPRRHFIAMKSIALDLLANSEYCWRNKATFTRARLDDRTFSTYESLHSLKIEVKSSEFASMTKWVSDRLVVGDDSAIYLPPPEDDPLFVPLLSMELDSNEPKASFRLDLFRFDDSAGSLVHIGFRFETPTLDGTKHLYYHVQPIEKARGRVVIGTRQSRNVPGTIPCVPIHADSPVALILCLILSLYGVEGYRKIMDNIGIDPVLTQEISSCFSTGSSWSTGWHD